MPIVNDLCDNLDIKRNQSNGVKYADTFALVNRSGATGPGERAAVVFWG